MKPGLERLAAVLVWAASLAPLWTWWTRRLGEPLDLDVVAWGTLAVLVAVRWRGCSCDAVRPAPWKLVLAAAGLAVFQLLRGAVPPTASGAVAVATGLPLLLPEGRASSSLLPLLGLAALGLPTAMILDLFLGLPLRAVATAAAGTLLEGIGLPVVRAGMELAVGGQAVWVDVPCAGVHMLGAGVFAAFVLAALFRLRWWRTALLAAAAVFTVVVANVARIVVLTLDEVMLSAQRGASLSPGAHTAVGCVLLVPAILAVALLAQGLARRTR